MVEGKFAATPIGCVASARTVLRDIARCAAHVSSTRAYDPAEAPVRRLVMRQRQNVRTGYGLSAQNRKKSGRVSPSFGLLRQRTRGEVPARGCCCGGGDQEAQAVRASSARTRRARVTAGYHTPADATRLRPSFVSRRRRAAPWRYEGARPARLRRAGHAARRDR